jgi:hypothetical protein
MNDIGVLSGIITPSIQHIHNHIQQHNKIDHTLSMKKKWVVMVLMKKEWRIQVEVLSLLFVPGPSLYLQQTIS